jgi:hypothetical protein
MPTLVSPGVSSYIVDESIYISNNAGATVPLFFVATKANKETYPGSNVTAPGTLESGVIRSVTSVAQLVALYGIPSFRSTVNAGVTLQHHGDCRNEYGLFAAYQFLQNGGAYCFVVRADIDLTDEPLDSNVTAKRVGTTIYGPTNTGNGTVGSITVSQATAKVETWTLTAMSASVFTVEGSVSGQGANAVVGVPYTNGAISFTITAGATPFALGDVIEIPVIDTPVYAGTGDGTIAGNVVLRSVGEVDTSNATNLPSEDMIGKGTIGQITPSGTAVAETWTLTAQDATTFTVEGSVSGAKPDATVGELYDNGLISFKLYPGATTFVAGDTFEFDVIVQNVIVQPETSTLEVWTIAAVNPTTFSVTGSVTGFTGNATVGTLYDNGKIAFTITAGATPFVAGDTFTVTIARAGGLPPLGVTHASKRTKIVQALQAAVNLNEDVRSEAYEYNLISCPGYPELADELTLLNRSINEEAFIVSGTPMEYNVEQTVNWCATPGRQFNTYIGYYYPHGLASNLDGVDIVCDAAGIALGIIAYSDSQSYLWFAPAGLRRGTRDDECFFVDRTIQESQFIGQLWIARAGDKIVLVCLRTYIFVEVYSSLKSLNDLSTLRCVSHTQRRQTTGTGDSDSERISSNEWGRTSSDSEGDLTVVVQSTNGRVPSKTSDRAGDRERGWVDSSDSPNFESGGFWLYNHVLNDHVELKRIAGNESSCARIELERDETVVVQLANSCVRLGSRDRSFDSKGSCILSSKSPSLCNCSTRWGDLADSTLTDHIFRWQVRCIGGINFTNRAKNHIPCDSTITSTSIDGGVDHWNFDNITKSEWGGTSSDSEGDCTICVWDTNNCVRALTGDRSLNGKHRSRHCRQRPSLNLCSSLGDGDRTNSTVASISWAVDGSTDTLCSDVAI